MKIVTTSTFTPEKGDKILIKKDTHEGVIDVEGIIESIHSAHCSNCEKWASVKTNEDVYCPTLSDLLWDAEAGRWNYDLT